MTHRRNAIPVVILTRRRPQQRDPDVVAVIVSGTFLMFAIAYAVLKAMEVIQ